MEAKVEEIKQLFREDRLIIAHEKLTQLGRIYIENTLSEEQKQSLLQMPEIEAIKEDLRLANILLEHLADLDSWEMVCQEGDIATFSNTTTTELVIRGEMLLHQPMTPLLSLFCEVDLLKDWVPILKDAKCLGQPSAFRRIIHYFFDLPWPVTDRDMVISAVGVPIPENNSVLMVLRGLDEFANSSFLGVPIPEAAGVRITCKIACLNVCILGPNEIQISIIAKVDPHMHLIPQQLINYATKHGVYYFLQAVKERCENYAGSVHEDCVNANPGYYQEVVSRINIP